VSRQFDIHRNHILGPELWIPDGVSETAKQVRELWVRLNDLKVRFYEARRAVESAPRKDRLAARAAVAEGRDVPPPSQPALAEEAAATEREVAAVEELLYGALEQQASAAMKCRDEWLDHLRESSERRTRKIENLLSALASELGELNHTLTIAKAVAEFKRASQLDLPLRDLEREQKLMDRTVERVRMALPGERQIRGSDTTRMIAALALQLEELEFPQTPAEVAD